MARPVIDRRLKIVFPHVCSDGTEFFVHSTPIGREIFSKYFLPISRSFASLYKLGLDYVAGPRIAMRMLRSVSEEMDMWDGEQGVRAGLVEEIFRLTNIVRVTPDKKGWQTVPFYVAMNDNTLDGDDIDEIEGVLAFFTCISTMHVRATTPVVLAKMDLWLVRTTLLNVTEYAASLPTSTEEEPSTPAPTVEALSIPS